MEFYGSNSLLDVYLERKNSLHIIEVTVDLTLLHKKSIGIKSQLLGSQFKTADKAVFCKSLMATRLQLFSKKQTGSSLHFAINAATRQSVSIAMYGLEN